MRSSGTGLHSVSTPEKKRSILFKTAYTMNIFSSSESHALMSPVLLSLFFQATLHMRKNLDETMSRFLLVLLYLSLQLSVSLVCSCLPVMS